MTSRPLSLLTQGEWDAIDKVLHSVHNRAVADYRRSVRANASKSTMYDDLISGLRVQEARMRAERDAFKAQYDTLRVAHETLSKSYESLHERPTTDPLLASARYEGLVSQVRQLKERLDAIQQAAGPKGQ